MTEVNTFSRLSALLESQDTPFYFYDIQALNSSIRELKNAFPIEGFQLLFATMANDNPTFLRAVSGREVGACINSIKHLDLVLECGFRKDRIQFTSTGVKQNDLLRLHSEMIPINFDSLRQLGQYIDLGRNLSAGLRINTCSLFPGIGHADRLGIEANQVDEGIRLAQRRSCRINGLHVYVGTNYKTHLEMMPAIEALFSLAERIPDLDYLNVGGGIGISYFNEVDTFDINAYGAAICRLMDRLRRKKGRNIQLIFEPGRRLAASSGAFVTRVTDIKELNNLRYIVIDGSIALFPRPLYHPESPHPASFPFVDNKSSRQESIIVGKTTFSRDILLKTSAPSCLDVGDVIVFEKAGAYCDSMRSRFLGQNEPESILVDDL